ncbi:MAG: lysophospholipid acyltransferase family protein, partial [Planctomycetota bacterium]
GHCGNWELLGYTLAVLGFPLHALYRPLDLKPLDRWIYRTRSHRGLTLIDKFGAAKVLPRVVTSGAPTGFIADQNAGDRGLFVPFFGRLASSYKTIALLAMRYEIPIVCGQAMRLSGLSADRAEDGADGVALDSTGARRRAQIFKYRLVIPDVIYPHEWKDQPDPQFYITARYRRAIEQMVRHAPEQYLWMHRYWKSRPRHEHLGRPFPDRLRDKIAALPWTTDEDIERLVERSARDAADLASGKGRKRR